MQLALQRKNLTERKFLFSVGSEEIDTLPADTDWLDFYVCWVNKNVADDPMRIRHLARLGEYIAADWCMVRVN